MRKAFFQRRAGVKSSGNRISDPGTVKTQMWLDLKLFKGEGFRTFQKSG